MEVEKTRVKREERIGNSQSERSTLARRRFMTSRKLALTTLLTGLITVTTSGPAHAATGTTTCVVNTIQYDNSSRLAVWCANISSPIVYGFGAPYTDCGSVGLSVTQDTLKVWQSMLQGALLSGRKVDLDWTTHPSCQGGSRAITYLRLQRQ